MKLLHHHNGIIIGQNVLLVSLAPHGTSVAPLRMHVLPTRQKMQMKEQTHDVPTRPVVQGMFCGSFSTNRSSASVAEQEAPNVILCSNIAANEALFYLFGSFDGWSMHFCELFYQKIY